jgi:predicted GIY-YIG superfamily endonuclease
MKKITYIGITERIVFHRMKEHNSKKTGKKETAIQMHKEEFPEHQINALDFEVKAIKHDHNCKTNIGG